MTAENVLRCPRCTSDGRASELLAWGPGKLKQWWCRSCWSRFRRGRLSRFERLLPHTRKTWVPCP
jgi:transposase-like protein